MSVCGLVSLSFVNMTRIKKISRLIYENISRTKFLFNGTMMSLAIDCQGFTNLAIPVDAVVAYIGSKISKTLKSIGYVRIPRYIYT